jgi:hypothetical protein
MESGRRNALWFAILVAAAVVAAAPAFALDPNTGTAQPVASEQPLPSPTPTIPGGLSALQIYRTAQRVARDNPDPPYMTYQMHEVFVHHGRPFNYDYRVWYRSDGKGMMQDMAPSRGGGHDPRFGYPFPVAPDDNILLYATPAPRSTVPPPVGGSQPIPSGAPTAQVLAVESVSADRYYNVWFVGMEDFDGHHTYHIGMQSINAEDREHPWKDMWVDAQTFEVWKAHASGSGSQGPAKGSIDADVWFGPVGAYWLITRAQGDGEVRMAFLSDSGHYEYYFSDFGFPNTLPDWYFDPGLFKHH